MSNPNPKNQIKTKKQASEMGKKSKRGISLKTKLKEVLLNGRIDPDEFIESMYKNAIKGNSGIARLIFDHMEGKPTEKIELTGTDGQPIENKLQIEFVEPKKSDK
jgi:hypothetical protein